MEGSQNEPRRSETSRMGRRSQGRTGFQLKLSFSLLSPWSSRACMYCMSTAELSHLEEGGLPFLICIGQVRSPQVDPNIPCRQGYIYKSVVANTHRATKVGIAAQ